MAKNSSNQRYQRLKIVDEDSLFAFSGCKQHHHVLSDDTSIFYGTEADKSLTSYVTDKSE
jgi:hypothetical protein